MKKLFSILLLLSAGCASPSHKYNTLRDAVQRATALSADGLSGGITVHDAGAPTLPNTLDERVLVFARFPENSRTVQYSVLQPETAKPVIEAALIQGLHRKGYRSASRVNVKSILTEQAFHPRGNEPAPTGEWFKGSAMLVVSVNCLESAPAKYETFDRIWVRSQSLDVGKRVTGHVSAELFAADSSESLWSATAQINELLLPSVSADAILEAMVRSMMDRLPSRGGGGTPK